MLIIFLLTIFIFIPLYKDYKVEEEKRLEEERIKNATIIVNLKEDLKTPLFTEIKVSDYITEINGNLIEDYIIEKLLKYLTKEKYEQPFWKMFSYEMGVLVKQTRNYKKYLEFQEKMQFATKRVT